MDAFVVHLTVVGSSGNLHRCDVDTAFFGLGPYLIKTGIRSNFLGEGTISHKLVEAAIGLFTQSPQTYAKPMVPLLFAPELEDRTGLMFGHKAQPILPTQGIDGAYIDRYVSASEALLRRTQLIATPGCT